MAATGSCCVCTATTTNTGGTWKRRAGEAAPPSVTARRPTLPSQISRSSWPRSGPRSETDFGMAGVTVTDVRYLGSMRPEIERVGEVAHVGTHSRERLELESSGDELDDRRRVVGRLVHIAALGEGRNDDRGNARARSPAVAPARSRGRRHVIPVAAVLVVGDDHRHLCPLRTLAQPFKHLGKVFVAARQIGVTRMLVETPGRLVEGYLWQRALFDVGKERHDVLQVARALGGARREARIVVEWVVVRLEDRAACVAVVDDVALRFRILPAVGKRFVPPPAYH